MVVYAIKQVFENVKIYVPYNSVIEKIALENGIEIVYEAFGDRNYNDNLTLVSRSLPYAIITDKIQVLKHVKKMTKESKVRTVTCNEIEYPLCELINNLEERNLLSALNFLSASPFIPSLLL